MHGCEQKAQSKMQVKNHEHKNQTSVEIQLSDSIIADNGKCNTQIWRCIGKIKDIF